MPALGIDVVDAKIPELEELVEEEFELEKLVELASARITALALLIPVRYAPCKTPRNCGSDPSPAIQIEPNLNSNW